MVPGITIQEYERLAQDLVAAFDAHDEEALRRLNAHYGRPFTVDDLWAEIWRRVYSFRQRAFKGDRRDGRSRAEIAGEQSTRDLKRPFATRWRAIVCVSCLSAASARNRS